MSDAAELVFVGGTGRSGTHIVASLLGRALALRGVPIECRFHCNPNGLADVVTGRATPEEFVASCASSGGTGCASGGRAPGAAPGVAARRRRRRRSAGSTRSSTRDRFDAAVARVRGEPRGDDVVAASRNALLRPARPARRGGGQAGAGRDELLHDRRRARPGADLPRGALRPRGARRARLGLLQGRPSARRTHHPTDATVGIDWWAERLRWPRTACAGWTTAGERLHAISLDELVWGDREGAYGGLLGFLGLADEPAMREFFDERDERRGRPSRALARGPRPRPEQEAIAGRYEASLERLEREGYHCAALLRRAYEQARAV